MYVARAGDFWPGWPKTYDINCTCTRTVDPDSPAVSIRIPTDMHGDSLKLVNLGRT